MSQFTEKELVAFGNYVLSDERNANFVHETNKKEVTDADVANYLAKDPFSMLISDLRSWQKEWDNYDKWSAMDAGVVLIKPKSVDGFITEIKEKFEVTLKQ